MIRAVGIDAGAGGWVGVALVDGVGAEGGGTVVGAEGGGTVVVDRVWFRLSLAELLVDEPPDAVVGIDIPLGGVPAGWRSADLRARELLGPGRSSVFLVPPHPVWSAPTYAEANARCRVLTGNGLSRQAYGLVTRMLEAEAMQAAGPHALHEVHPELVFSSLAGKLLPYGKKSWNGQLARRGLLAGVGVALPDELPRDAGRVPADDILDAAAVAWCAHRIFTGQAARVPEPPDQFDGYGRPIVIWTG